ncbi:PREDICTED: uncharacterized protein LOC109584772 [Amphimedon queenslandica]|nr:PREDICTED: uncharacterized protein LOC109584772 [Amphimedon queenslandica]|eukprot:XP_019856187.1 PREDICTED: uncharacterized protein LOC109584772 [Amphimedon queenslandica]
MPRSSGSRIKNNLSVASLALLFVSLGAAGTSLGLIQANTSNGASCNFFITYSQLINESLYNYNVPTCKLSIASATIATICLALLTAIELFSVLYSMDIKTLFAKIMQTVFFTGSIVTLSITTTVVSAGWGKTCFTYFNITSKHPDTDSGFHCDGPQYTSSGSGPFPPNGGEFITAAVCAGFGALLTILTLSFFIVKQRINIYVRPQNLNVQDEFPMTSNEF